MAHRIDSVNKQVDKFGSGKHGYTEGEPGVTPATETTEDAFDMFQEEIIGPVEHMAIPLDKTDHGQLIDAIKAMFQVFSIENLSSESNVALNLDLRSVAHNGSDLFVGVGETDGVDSLIVTSPDGQTWTRRGVGTLDNVNLNCVIYDTINSLWIAVGNTDAFDPGIYTSPDGTNWTKRTPTVHKALSLLSVASNGVDLIVAVGTIDGAESYMVSSTNGTIWTEVDTPDVAVNLNEVAYNGSDLWIAVGDDDGSKAYIISSADGATWSQVSPTVSKTVDLLSVVYNDVLDLWVAVGDTDSGETFIVSSSDGVTWTEVNPGLGNWGANHISAIGGLFVVVGEATGIGAYIIWSRDGANWYSVVNPKNFALNASGYGDGVFLLVGVDDGVGPYTLSSLRAKFAG